MPSFRRSIQWAGATLIAGAGLMSSACTIQPWVKPYERDRLADPIADAVSPELVGGDQRARAAR